MFYGRGSVNLQFQCEIFQDIADNLKKNVIALNTSRHTIATSFLVHFFSKLKCLSMFIFNTSSKTIIAFSVI